MKKSLSLIEALVSLTVFSLLSVCCFLFLHSALRLRQKLEVRGTDEAYYVLEMLAKELNNVFIPVAGDPAYAFKGSQMSLSFCAHPVRYPEGLPRAVSLSYVFSQGELTKKEQCLFSSEEPRIAGLLKGDFKLSFYYCDDQDSGEKWKTCWDKPDKLPCGVRVSISVKCGPAITKYIFIPQA